MPPQNRPSRRFYTLFVASLGIGAVILVRLFRKAPLETDTSATTLQDTPTPPLVPDPPPPITMSPLEITDRPARAFSFVRWMVFLLLLVVFVIGFPALDFPIRGPIFLIVLISTILLGLIYGYAAELYQFRRVVWAYYRNARRTTPKPDALVNFTPIPRRQLLVELGIIIAVGLWVTSDLRTTGPDKQLYGNEAEWLTSGVYLAHNTLKDWGKIPTWQPYLEMGEPLIDNPFSFILNPISSVPSLILGGIQGIKLSIVLYAVFAGIGGWYLGRVLGLGIVGRVLLGLLMIGKGNMHGTILSGYYQLGVAQAYFPWVIGGTLEILRHPSRRAVGLTAVLFTLMFFAGNIWYTLPTLAAMILLAFTHSSFLGWRKWFNGRGLKHLLLAGIFTIGLTAPAFLPIWINREHIGDHDPVKAAGAFIEPNRGVQLFFQSDLMFTWQTTSHEPDGKVARGEPHFYYSYVSPLWFLLILFVVLPPMWPLLHQPATAKNGRIWLVAIIMIVVTTLWGIGNQPLFLWLYEKFEFLQQWRFVGRALAVASFWLAVLIALRADGLLRAIGAAQWRWLIGDWPWMARRLRQFTAGVFVVLSAVAAYHVNAQWFMRFQVENTHPDIYECVSWLRAQYPNREIALERVGYDRIRAFLDNRVRKTPIEADYEPWSGNFTLGNMSLVREQQLRFQDVEYGMVNSTIQKEDVLNRGFHVVEESPMFFDEPCLYYNPENEVPYIYTVSLSTLETTFSTQELYPQIKAVNTYLRTPDTIYIALETRTDQNEVLLVQEISYPGWEVYVDGQRRDVEIVGHILGVILPVGGVHQVVFQYRPPLYILGTIIMVITIGVLTGYLFNIGERLQQPSAHRY